MAVPQSTVVMLAGVASVYTVDKQTHEVKQTNIQVGETEGEFFEVTGGLNGDEMLAANQLNQLVSGMKVNTGGGRGGDGAEVDNSGEGGAPAAGDNSGAGGRGGRGGRGGGRGGRGGRGGGGQGSSDQRGGGQS